MTKNIRLVGEAAVTTDAVASITLTTVRLLWGRWSVRVAALALVVVPAPLTWALSLWIHPLGGLLSVPVGVAWSVLAAWAGYKAVAKVITIDRG
jgi:hypothetical protein